eukprot:14680915-Heterocapsa_arctica.AAC.1
MEPKRAAGRAGALAASGANENAEPGRQYGQGVQRAHAALRRASRRSPRHQAPRRRAGGALPRRRLMRAVPDLVVRVSALEAVVNSMGPGLARRVQGE